MEAQPQGALSWRLSSHPITLLCFLGFRISSLLVYLLGTLFISSFVLIFIITILLLACDFYYLKNIAGRRLVGLRWWNEYDADSGESHWVFESSDPAVKVINATDSQFFWIALYAQPVLWIALAVLAIVSNWKWLPLVVVALGLTITNTLAFSRCDKFGQASNLAGNAFSTGSMARNVAGGMAFGTALNKRDALTQALSEVDKILEDNEFHHSDHMIKEPLFIIPLRVVVNLAFLSLLVNMILYFIPFWLALSLWIFSMITVWCLFRFVLLRFLQQKEFSWSVVWVLLWEEVWEPVISGLDGQQSPSQQRQLLLPYTELSLLPYEDPTLEFLFLPSSYIDMLNNPDDALLLSALKVLRVQNPSLGRTKVIEKFNMENGWLISDKRMKAFMDTHDLRAIDPKELDEAREKAEKEKTMPHLPPEPLAEQLSYSKRNKGRFLLYESGDYDYAVSPVSDMCYGYQLFIADFLKIFKNKRMEPHRQEYLANQAHFKPVWEIYKAAAQQIHSSEFHEMSREMVRRQFVAEYRVDPNLSEHPDPRIEARHKEDQAYQYKKVKMNILRELYKKQPTLVPLDTKGNPIWNEVAYGQFSVSIMAINRFGLKPERLV